MDMLKIILMYARRLRRFDELRKRDVE